MTIAGAASIAALVGAIGGGVFILEDRYAHQTAMSGLSQRLDLYIAEDRAAAFQGRLWALQDRFGPDCGPRRDECRWLHAEIQKLRARIDRMQQQRR